MSMDTLQASPRRKLPIPPSTPNRNILLGPTIRSPQRTQKPSAVERLEADKAKYVKSQQVALKKQQPAAYPTNSSQNGQISQLHSRKIPSRSVKSETPPLDLEHLCKLIDGVGDGSVSLAQPALEPPSVTLNQEKAPPISTMTIRRVDVRPQLPQNKPTGRGPLPNQSPMTPSFSQMPLQLLRLLRPYKPNQQPLGFKRLQGVANTTRGPVKALNRVEQTSPAFKSPTSPLLSPNPEQSSPQSPSLAKNEDPPSPAFTHLSTTSSRKRPSLTRSKSDVSDCVSRAGAELERFFNYCGLEPSDLEELARPGSDIVSVSRLRSASAPTSERTAEGDEEEDEAIKDQPMVSVIERNARVIKWLYGMRQAKESPKVVNV